MNPFHAIFFFQFFSCPFQEEQDEVAFNKKRGQKEVRTGAT